MDRPDDKVLTHNGIEVGVWFQSHPTTKEPNVVATIMPKFGGYFEGKQQLAPYNHATK